MLDYEKLDVYQCAIEHLSRVFKWLAQLPRGYSALADQWSRRDVGACYAIARGEAMECGAILDVVRLLQVIPDTELERGNQLVVRTVEMLTKLCR